MSITDRLRNIDLNLLVALDVVLRTKSVSRAASEMGVSQPAMSKTVARLRRYFDDELLVRRGRQYELTGFARSLQHGVTEALGTIDRAMNTRKAFDPDEAFDITVVASEVLAALMAPVLSKVMRAQAPRSVLRIVSPTFEPGSASNLDRLSAGSLDGLILPHGWIDGLEHIDLLDDEWVFVVSADDPVTRLEMSDLEKRPWVVVRLPHGELQRGMQQVASAGVRPRIEVEAGPSMAVPLFLHGTDRVAVIGRSMIDAFGPLLGVKEVAGPVALGHHRHAFWWDAGRRDDARHTWLRNAVVDVSLALSTVDHG